MNNILNTFAFNALMAFLMIVGLVNSIIAVPTTWLIGAFGIAGNILGLAYFVFKAYNAWKNKE